MIINQRLFSLHLPSTDILHGSLVIFCFLMDSFYCTQAAPGILCSLLLFAARIQMANLLSARSLTDKRKGRKTAHTAAHAHFSCKILRRQTPGPTEQTLDCCCGWMKMHEFFKDRWAGETAKTVEEVS